MSAQDAVIVFELVNHVSEWALTLVSYTDCEIKLNSLRDHPFKEMQNLLDLLVVSELHHIQRKLSFTDLSVTVTRKTSQLHNFLLIRVDYAVDTLGRHFFKSQHICQDLRLYLKFLLLYGRTRHDKKSLKNSHKLDQLSFSLFSTI